MKKLVYIFSVCVVFFSCEKVIDLDLNSTNPKVVIEASINNEPGPYQVRVTRTVNYDAPEENFINNALVIIQDDLGAIDTLLSIGNGVYQTQSTVGAIGRTYTLSVSVEGETYTHSSYMHDLVELDTVIAELTVNPFTFEPQMMVTGKFTDPGTPNDYYRMFFFVRGKDTISGYADFILIDDPDSDSPVELQRRLREDLIPNDTIDVELRHIDRFAYDYYFTLSELIDAGFAPQGIPDNPKTAWSNGAQGYFSAYAVGHKQIIITN